MLYYALLFSALLLFVVNLAVRVQKHTAIVTFVVGFLAPFAGVGYLAATSFSIIPVVLWNGLFVGVSIAFWSFWKRRTKPSRRSVLILSLAATIAAYLVSAPRVIRESNELARVREVFPFESMEGRAPYFPSMGEVPPHDPDRLNNWEKEIEKKTGAPKYIDRVRGLKLIHENSVNNFVDSWGFGFQRMPPRDEDGLRWRSEPAPLQPSNPNYVGPMGAAPLSKTDSEKLHADAAINFVHPQSFGYIRDRFQVSGFESHGFFRIPQYKDEWEAKKQPLEWEVARLELIGLLMHKEPAVYLSDRLPQMDALKGVPTRPLDSFESDGLAALRKGEDLYIKEDRMVGSIRSAKQCITCHGGERGMLLGAFTYTLRPASK